MKLYATTTSERASKGQGGNEYLVIDIKNEKQQKQWSILITSQNVLRVADSEKEGLIIFKDESKKTQKGNISCHQCGKKFSGLEGKEDTCPQCLEKIIKGKQKKDSVCYCDEAGLSAPHMQSDH